MLTEEQKRCVRAVLQDRIRLLANEEAREELGISPVNISTIADMAQELLEHAALLENDDIPHRHVLESFFFDVEDYGDWDPWQACQPSTVNAMVDADLASYLRELVGSSRHVWGIPRGENLKQSLLPPPKR